MAPYGASPHPGPLPRERETCAPTLYLGRGCERSERVRGEGRPLTEDRR
jgi:hypothetical protein